MSPPRRVGVSDVIPAEPASITATGAPFGVEVKSVLFAASRPAFVPRAIHIHTNGASREGSIYSAWNWTHANPGSNTLPHYQVDMTHGDVTRCRKMLATNLRGIGSGTVTSSNGDWPTLTDEQRATITAHGDCRHWTIVVETADTGYLADPTISAFDAGQVELIATIVAYEAIVWDIPLVTQVDYWSPGVAAHTDPYGYPYTTLMRGKICPGGKKKMQVRDSILPRAQEIYAAWTAPPPAPEPGDDDLTPEQSQQLDEIHKALHANDYPFPGMVNMRTQVDRTYSIMSTFWDGFPGSIVDGAGVLARTIKNTAAKVGAKIG